MSSSSGWVLPSLHWQLKWVLMHCLDAHLPGQRHFAPVAPYSAKNLPAWWLRFIASILRTLTPTLFNCIHFIRHIRIIVVTCIRANVLIDLSIGFYLGAILSRFNPWLLQTLTSKNRCFLSNTAWSGLSARRWCKFLTVRHHIWQTILFVVIVINILIWDPVSLSLFNIGNVQAYRFFLVNLSFLWDLQLSL